MNWINHLKDVPEDYRFTARNRYWNLSRYKHIKPSWFDEFDEFVMIEISLLAVIREVETGIRWHIDHIVPVKGNYVCGLHCSSNVRLLPASINISKKNHTTMKDIPKFCFHDNMRLREIKEGS